MATLTVAEVRRLTDDAVAVTFEVPEADRPRFRFEAGQALTLCRTVDGVEHRRTYSLCAEGEGPLRIGVREVPGGLFSPWLVHGLTRGDTVTALPPSGGFRADPKAGGRHLCIAAGSGITPVLSIVASLLRNPDAHVTLVYGNRTTASVMFADDLADLKDAHPDRFQLVHVLSREPRESELLSGRLDPDRLRRLLTALVPLDDLDHVWLCGPLGLVLGAREVLDELGVPRSRVHVELFFVDEPPPPVRHVEASVGETSRLTLQLAGRRTTGAAARERTLLDSAQRLRGDVPFACKGGVCGTCRARVTGGEVDLVRNYALEADEVEDGFVLTCQAYPVSDAVAIDFDA